MQILNRTPHPISISVAEATPASTITISAALPEDIARVETIAHKTEPLYVDSGIHVVVDGKLDPRPTADRRLVPTATMSWGKIVGLPPPSVHYRYIVSVIVAAAAHAEGRDISDLYVPGDQVRDASGRIVGCMALTPAVDALPGNVLRLSPRGEMVTHFMDVAALLCYRDDVTTGEQPFATRRRGSWPMQAHFIIRRPEAHGGGYARITQEWGTDAWEWREISAEQAVAQYYTGQGSVD